jgi:integrase
MARALNKLSAKAVASLVKQPGRHSDGGGLYLEVDGNGARWLFMFKRNGANRREMGLGGATGGNAVSLADARGAAAKARDLLARGVDPIAERKRQDNRGKIVTFGEAALAHIERKRAGWKNAKHGQQWGNTLQQHGAKLWTMPVAEVDTEAVLACLQPIWLTIPETASRVRQRIEAVLDAAKVLGLREGENPARLKGHLDHLLAKAKKGSVGHHAALPWQEIPDFVADLKARKGMAPRALEFLIYTAARTGEVLGATWAEIDLKERVWLVPAERMKAGVAHRVPLTDAAIALLKAVKLEGAGAADAVFPGQDLKKPMSNMAMLQLLKRMKANDRTTAHGFRSSFRQWVQDHRPSDRDAAEAALAHQLGDDVERAYARSDLFARRVALMAAWSNFVDGEAAAAPLRRIA